MKTVINNVGGEVKGTGFQFTNGRLIQEQKDLIDLIDHMGEDLVDKQSPKHYLCCHLVGDDWSMLELNGVYDIIIKNGATTVELRGRLIRAYKLNDSAAPGLDKFLMVPNDIPLSPLKSAPRKLKYPYSSEILIPQTPEPTGMSQNPCREIPIPSYEKPAAIQFGEGERKLIL